MKLLFDVGNTRIKCASFANGALHEVDQIVHGSDPAAGVALLHDRCALKPDQVLVSNVAGSGFDEAISAGVESRWNLTVEFARSQSSAGSLRNGYVDCNQLGGDRWLAMLAAVTLYRKAVCLVDAGTAVTIDQVDGHGQHVGGIIVPGLDLMRQALTGNTGNLERLAGTGRKPQQDESVLFGQSTDAAITGGAVAAIRGLIEDCQESAQQNFGDPVLVITGGDAERVIPHLRISSEHHPLLVLEGLAIYVPE